MSLSKRVHLLSSITTAALAALTSACAPAGSSGSAPVIAAIVAAKPVAERPAERRILSENKDWVVAKGPLSGVGQNVCHAITNASASSGVTTSVEVVIPKSQEEITAIFVSFSDSKIRSMTAEIKGSRIKMRGIKMHSDASSTRFWIIGSDPVSIKAALAKGSTMTVNATNEAGESSAFNVSLAGSTATFDSAGLNCLEGLSASKQIEIDFYRDQAAGRLLLNQAEQIDSQKTLDVAAARNFLKRLEAAFVTFSSQDRARISFRQSLAQTIEAVLNGENQDIEVSDELRPVLDAAQKVVRRLVESRGLQDSIVADLAVLRPQNDSAADLAAKQEAELAKATTLNRPMFEKNNALVKALGEAQAAQRDAEKIRAQAEADLTRGQAELSKLKASVGTLEQEIVKARSDEAAQKTKQAELEGRLTNFDPAAEEARVIEAIRPGLDRRVNAARSALRAAQQTATNADRDFAGAARVQARCAADSADCAEINLRVENLRTVQAAAQNAAATARAEVSAAESARTRGLNGAKGDAAKKKKSLESEIQKTAAARERFAAALTNSIAAHANTTRTLIPSKEAEIVTQTAAVETARAILARANEFLAAQNKALADFRATNKFAQVQVQLDTMIRELANKRSDVERLAREAARRKAELEKRRAEGEVILAEFDALLERVKAVDAPDARAIVAALAPHEEALRQSAVVIEAALAAHVQEAEQILAAGLR